METRGHNWDTSLCLADGDSSSGTALFSIQLMDSRSLIVPMQGEKFSDTFPTVLPGKSRVPFVGTQGLNWCPPKKVFWNSNL